MTQEKSSNHMQRGLTNLHIQMIALGGAIGTGLFYGSASTIKLAGPAITISYMLGGMIIFFIMRMLGEMCVQEPVAASFNYFPKKYWSDFAGFLAGWNYYILYALVSMAELTAVGIYMNHWFPDLPQWISALVCLIIITAANLIHVKHYGQIESVMSFIKIAAIVAMILLGLVLLFSNGKPFPDNFSNLWAYGGFMPNGWSSVAQSMVVVIFSFGGIELIGMTAGEVENPEKVLPRAINQVLIRILIFYVGAILVLTALFPWNQVGSSGSPFVIIFEHIGIPAAANILNFVVLIAAISVYNSAIYANSRMLYGLAKAGQAPKFFGKLSATGVPIVGILVSSGITLVSVILNYLMPKEVFNYVMTITVVAIIICWACIVLTHMKFREAKKAEGTENQIKYKSMLYPLDNYICLAFLAAVVYMMFVLEDFRTAAYLLPVWLLVVWISYKISMRNTNN